MTKAFPFFFMAFCIFAPANPLDAQWVQAKRPNVGIIQCFVGKGTNLFAGTFGGGVFLSTNNGTTWTAANSGLTNANVFALAFNGTNFFAGTGSGVFVSTNNGSSWTEKNIGLTNTFVISFAMSDTNLFVGTNGGGVFVSTNNGVAWTAVNNGLANSFVHVLAMSGTNLFAGTDGGGVFLSANSGTSWTAINAGLPLTAYIFSLISKGTNLFAVTSAGNVWRRPLSEIITSVERSSIDLPTHFGLEQSYPNPFNPAATISFGLPSRSFVTLKVFDAPGREVSILVSEELSPGTHVRQRNAAGLASGVYFLRLKGG